MINLEKGLQDGWNLVNESAYVLKQSEKKGFLWAFSGIFVLKKTKCI